MTRCGVAVTPTAARAGRSGGEVRASALYEGREVSAPRHTVQNSWATTVAYQTMTSVDPVTAVSFVWPPTRKMKALWVELPSR